MAGSARNRNKNQRVIRGSDTQGTGRKSQDYSMAGADWLRVPDRQRRSPSSGLLGNQVWVEVTGSSPIGGTNTFSYTVKILSRDWSGGATDWVDETYTDPVTGEVITPSYDAENSMEYNNATGATAALVSAGGKSLDYASFGYAGATHLPVQNGAVIPAVVTTAQEPVNENDNSQGTTAITTVIFSHPTDIQYTACCEGTTTPSPP